MRTPLRTVQTYTFLTKEQHAHLKALSERTGVSMSGYLRVGCDLLLQKLASEQTEERESA
jgi:hypothetical protein